MQDIPRVLVVDDEPDNLMWLFDLIHNRGHEVEIAANEQAARERLQAVKAGAEHYVLAIIDVMVATHDLSALKTLDGEFFKISRDTGIRLCQYARLELGLSDVELPIVCLTIRHDDDVKTAMSELGIQLYVRHDDDSGESIQSLIDQKLGPLRPAAGAGAEP